MNTCWFLFLLFIFCSSGPAPTALVGGHMVSVGRPLLAGACACAAPAPPTPTTTLRSRSPFSRTLSTRIIPIIPCRPRCSSPDISEEDGIGGLFPWNSQNCSGQADRLRHRRPSSSPTTGERASLGRRARSPEAREPAAVWERTTVTATARRRVTTTI